MPVLQQDFGKPSPDAPPELHAFAFLIGQWQCNAKIKTPKGDWQRFEAQWIGRFILEGHAIADEYRMTTLAGELLVLGMNIRSFDTATRIWNIRWLDALNGTWTNLVSPELGGVLLKGDSITYAFKEPVAAHPYTRATYTSHSPTRFTWRGDQSTDAQTWSDFMFVECYRNQ
jgi:hypothetical protein